MKAERIDILPCRALLGEGIVWDDETSSLWWTDIEGRRLWNATLSGAMRSFATPERLTAFAFTSMTGRLLAAFESGLALYEPESGRHVFLARPEAGRTGRRFNDGRADRFGRFWVGTMVEDAARAGARSARLYCLDRDGELRVELTGITIANGIAFSPDGSRLYFADSPTRRISSYPLEGEDRRPGRPGDFAMTPEAVFPDGAAVDAEGCYWSARWGGGEVVRHAPDGRIIGRIAIGLPQPSCVCFAGPELDLLCVTTARVGLSPERLAAERGPAFSGDVLIYRLDVAGLPENRYEGVIDHRGP